MPMSSSRRMRVTPEGWLYLFLPAFVLAGGIYNNINLLIILGGMLLAPFLLSWRWVGGALKSLHIDRRGPDYVAAGETLAVDVFAENRHPRGGVSWAVEVQDEIHSLVPQVSRPVARPRALFTQVPVGQSVSTTYRGVLERRGRYQLGPLQVTTSYPLGFVKGTMTVPHTEELVVYPPLGELNRQWSELQREAVMGGRQTRRRPGTFEGDFYGMRDWRAGDSRRWIHWRTTARKGTLTVRQFEQPRNEDLAVVLDLFQPGDAERDLSALTELAISFAATVFSDLCRRGGGHVILAIAGSELSVTRGFAAPVTLRDGMERLAVAQPGTEDHLAEALRYVWTHAESNMRTVLISRGPVNLSDGSRIPSDAWDSRLSAALLRTTVFDCGGAHLRGVFTPPAILADSASESLPSNAASSAPRSPTISTPVG